MPDKYIRAMRQTTKELTVHLFEPLAVLIESYIIHETEYFYDMVTAGHWEIIDETLNGCRKSMLDIALYGAARGDSIALVQHILDRGANDYGGALLGACCRTNLDAAKLVLSYDREFGFASYKIHEHMSVLGEFSKSIEMFTWFCDEFRPSHSSIKNTISGAIKSENMLMLSAALSRGGALDGYMMYEAGYSGSLAMVVLISQYTRDYNPGLAGASEGGHLKLVKWFVARGATNFDHAFRNAQKYFDILVWLAERASISSSAITYVLIQNFHMRRATDSESIVRWIVAKRHNLINHNVKCHICTRPIRNHMLQ